MSAKPLHKGSMRESIGCDDENFSSPKESRLRAIRGGSFFFIKNIPHSDNSDCKGITLNNKKSKDFIDTNCLSSIPPPPKGYCFVASIGAHFDSQCPERCNFINSTFLSSCKFSANRAKMQIYLRFSEVPPKFKPRSGLKIVQVDSKNAAQQIKFSANRVKSQPRSGLKIVQVDSKNTKFICGDKQQRPAHGVPAFASQVFRSSGVKEC